MKQFEGVFQEKDKMEISIQKKQQKEKELVGKIIPHGNHKVWEINDETLEVQEAKYEQQNFIFGIKNTNPEIIIRSGFSYVSALTKKTALKKYKNGQNGSKEMGNMEIKLF